jgi:hypothetical protein
VIQLKAASHWLAWPHRASSRYGWVGAGILWISMIALVSVLNRFGRAEWAAEVGGAWFLFAVYTWINQPLLRRYFAAKGF